MLVLRLLEGVLELAEALLHPADVPAGHAAGILPPPAQLVERAPSGLDVREREQLLAVGEDLLLHLQVGPVLAVDLLVRGLAGGEEDVLGGAEAGPEGVVLLAGGPGGALPLVHQVAVLAGGHAPVGGGGQLLGTGDETLLDLLGLGRGGVQPGEVGAAGLVERGAGAAEALPQVVLDRLGQTRTGLLGGLPLLEQLRHALGRGLPGHPLGRGLGEGLGLGDDGLAGGQLLGLGGLPGLLFRGAVVAQEGLQGRQAGAEGVHVADHVALVHRGRHLTQRPAQLTRGGAGGDALLEQGHLGAHVVVLAHEVRQRVLGARVRHLADRVLLLPVQQRDVAVLAHPGEPGGLLHRGGRHGRGHDGGRGDGRGGGRRGAHGGRAGLLHRGRGGHGGRLGGLGGITVRRGVGDDLGDGPGLGGHGRIGGLGRRGGGLGGGGLLVVGLHVIGHRWNSP
ncbi:Uncharacterised protein [Streptococcus pneumoniae]|nr:Uncharacterised protein [Streptococcus pneumoniae]